MDEFDFRCAEKSPESEEVSRERFVPRCIQPGIPTVGHSLVFPEAQPILTRHTSPILFYIRVQAHMNHGPF